MEVDDIDVATTMNYELTFPGYSHENSDTPSFDSYLVNLIPLTLFGL